jgi:lipopolysaccharide biosynthesis glycosyltransferase
MSGAPAPIVVASAVDRNFLPFVEIVALSIAATANPGRAVAYHVLYEGPQDRLYRRLQGFRRGEVTVHLHPIANPWTSFGTINKFPPSTWLRLSLEDALPTGIERVIYLDVDLMVCRDLGDLFDLPMDGHALGATIDLTAQRWLADPRKQEYHHYIRETLGLGDAASTYFQAGVLLLDLPKLRRSGFKAKMVEAVHHYGTLLRYADQCAANAVLKDDYKQLDPRWNMQPIDIANEPNPWILHFAGFKPWRTLGMPGGDRWWKLVRNMPGFPYFVLRFIRERGGLELNAARIRIRRKFGKAP